MVPTARVHFTHPPHARRDARTPEASTFRACAVHEHKGRTNCLPTCLIHASSPSPTGPFRPITSRRPSRAGALTSPSSSIRSTMRAARG